jgi:predicted glycosyltransferase
MKILIKIGHPAQVHLFKNLIGDLERDGHIVKIVTKDKDVALDLLDAYGLKYEVVSGYSTTMISKVYNFVKTDLKLLKIAIKNKPDILIAVGDPYVAHVGMLIKKPSIIFTDTEHAKLANKLTFPFTTTICTPSSFKKDLGKKQVRYNGYHELAYLHPNYFTPDPGVLDDLNLTTDDKFIIIRFVAWAASHDLGQFGISDDMKVKYISKLEQYGNVFISSENKLGKEFEKYKLKISPEKFHSLLSYAQLYIGEGGSTATEAAILGTPSIHISSTAKFCGVFDDLLNKYNLIYTFDNDQNALEKAVEILTNPQSKKMWMSRRDAMLKEKIDVTEFMTEFIEEYPESFYRIKSNEVESCSQES